MALSLSERAERRSDEWCAAIRDSLSEGSGKEALNAALLALQSEAAKKRRRKPADGALLDASLAGTLAGYAAQLYRHKPERPPGCPRVPRPIDLLTVFTAAYDAAASPDVPGEGE